MTLRLVAATVALQGWFPALRLGGAGEKRQIWRPPVPFHEELQIVMVPGIGLGLQERSNFRGSARCGSAVNLRLPKNNCRQQQDHPAYRTQLHHLHLRSQRCSRVLSIWVAHFSSGFARNGAGLFAGNLQLERAGTRSGIVKEPTQGAYQLPAATDVWGVPLPADRVRASDRTYMTH